ncbi:MAG TPA: nucleotidyltransferase family protein [Candidatus Sulfotelmatobacter sp.]|nr:nucleotidyltransferase family protein [Candidatus Sulfotelmatobacter sp.]
MPDIGRNLRALSSLTLEQRPNRDVVAEVSALGTSERESFVKLANTHHVLIRALHSLEQGALELRFVELEEWARASLAMEKIRVRSAVQALADICDALESAGCPTTVMKSLDHWPDVGRDFDLYTSADMQAVKNVLCGKFRAIVLPRSWGDCLANKCSFNLPGLDRTIEMHSGRLGQGGEHVELAARVERRRVSRAFEGCTFYVPAPEEQLMAATLQRMYRHMFFRICEFANTARLIDCDCIDYRELIPAAKRAGVWHGVATFLTIICDYVSGYRELAPQLPEQVRDAAGFGAEQFVVRGQYLRVPLVPQAAGLFVRQFAGAALRGNVSAAVRLSLLPPLASMAALAYKVTGSNQGIW